MPEADPQRSRRRTTYTTQAKVEAFIVPLVGREVRTLLERVAVAAPAGSRVLDIGCGGQPFRADLEGLGYVYAGMDVSDADSAPDFVGRIDAPLEGALAEVAPFDLLLCTEVLEHVPNWPQAFANFATLLRPGGVVIATTPHLYLLHEEPHDYWRPTPYAFAWHAEQAGLHVESLMQAGSMWDVLGTVTAIGQIRPTEGTAKARILSYLLNRALQWLWPRLQSGQLARYCKWEAPFYLSTVALLSKPAS